MINERDFNIWIEVIEEVAKIIKTRFPNLTTEDTIKITNSIVATVRLTLDRHPDHGN